ncbi:MAG: helicase SNF2 [Variovorax paradoxus]|nr:MAG: helicase SNF2 [Variovorax paradoxus]PZQ10045.1 MAG: helicase SNF2 [Variovorax paradoxus]
MPVDLLIDPQSIAPHLPAATYARGLQVYLNQGVLEHQLRAESAQRWQVDGVVRGSEREPYDTSLVMELGDDGQVLRFDASCSCPVAQRCKHAVALALKAAYAAGAVRRPAMPTARPVVPSAPAAPRAEAAMHAWLDLFDTAPVDSAARAAAGNADVPLYLLSVAPQAAYGTREPPRLQLAWQVSRALKRGGWSRPKVPGHDALLRIAALATAEPNDDRECVRLIQSLGGQRHGYGTTHSGTVDGAVGSLALQAAARTGRLFAVVESGEMGETPLRWGPPRRLLWQWHETKQPREAESLWVLRAGVAEQGVDPEAADARPAPRTGVYGAQSPLYLDLEHRCCGPVDSPGLDAAQLRLLLAAPPLPQSAFGDEHSRLLERLAGLPLPPVVAPPERWPQVPPVPCLRLARVPAAERAQRGLLRATLDFDYAGLRGHWFVPQAQVLVAHAGSRVVLTRDVAAERGAEARLQALGLVGDAVSRFHLPAASMVWLDWAMDDWAPLRAAGFDVQADADLAGFVQQADALLVQVASPPPGHDDAALEDALRAGTDVAWFDLSLGIAIDGARHNVLPWLPALLRQVRYTPDGPQMPPWLWREQLDGRWLRLPSAPLQPWLQALLDLVGERPERDLEADALRLSRLEALRMGVLLGEGAVWDGAEGLRQLLRELVGGAPPAVAPPTGLNAQLRPYQQQGLNWLQFLRRAGLSGLLADDMGLGKTLQTLAHLLREHEDGRLDRPSLVLAPVSVLGNWRREAERFAPALRTRVWHGADRHKADFSGCDLVVAPYSLLQRDRELWLGQRWHLVVLDEAQHIKNASTQAAQVAASLQARQRLCLSGTPMENHLGELWSLFHFLMPGFLGSQARFREVFRQPIEKHADTQCLALLRRRITPFMLHRTKAAVATELPARSESVSPVTLDGAQADLYETIRLATEKSVRAALADKGLARSQIQVLDALLKLRQVCCDPRLVKATPGVTQAAGSAKLDLLMEMLPELLDEGRRVLLFSQFTGMLALIEAALRERKIPFATLTGQTQQRDAVIERFTSGAVPLFLISLKAGGTGLNLPQADTVIHYDPWWNPAVEEQATARAHRIGQQRQVMVYKLVAEGTIEERILDLQARKAALAQGLLHGAATREAPLFSEDDVAELLRPIG